MKKIVFLVSCLFCFLDASSQEIKISKGSRYNPHPSQCDDSPFHTADGSYIDMEKLEKGEIRWVALSWDLVDNATRRRIRKEKWAWRGVANFGDTIWVSSESNPLLNGPWVVHDVMNGRFRKSIDFLCHPNNKLGGLGICKDIILTTKNNNKKVMEQERYQKTLVEMTSKEEMVERAEVALKIVNYACDRTMVSELNNFCLTMQTAKSEGEQQKVMNSLLLYTKKQLSMVFAQAFQEGQTFQHNLALKAIAAIREEEEKIIVSEEVKEKA